MPLVETKGAASAQGFGQFARVAAPVYIEDVMSVFLYTGNGSTQTITNGIDLSGKGGLVWIKGRAGTYGTASNRLFDTDRGANKPLSSNSTSGQGSTTQYLTSFNSTGFALGNDGEVNDSSTTYASWTFRKQAKFFDVVTYTGDNASNRAINHSLGSVPGCIIVKSTSSTTFWRVYHRSLGTGSYLTLNDTAASISGSLFPTTPTSTQFFVNGSTGNDVNGIGDTYVAYLFAHDAGGFGQSGSDNVISCGSLTSGGTVNLGWEPQWVLCRWSNAASNWTLVDNMRGMPVGSSDAELYANLSNAETLNNVIEISSTGFTAPSAWWGSTNTIIYIAIRRGPMKTPTTGTSVFQPTVYTGTNVDNRLVDMSLLTDMVFVRQRDDTVLGGMVVGDRLRGDPYLLTGTTAAEVSDADSFMTPTSGVGNSWSAMNGFGVGNDATSKLNASTTSNNQIAEGFRRAPGFFDVVCYTGTGVARTVTHNLGAVPEMMIVKVRSTTNNWAVYNATVGNNKYLSLDQNIAATTSSGAWNTTSPTSSVFTVGTNGDVNANTQTFVAYLFATCPGVSKVGSYTGTGNVLQIDCGFTGGARFVLIKRTDSTGDWYVWDSARGIVAGNDPYLLLNSTAAEVTTTDWVDTYSAGFELSNAGGNNANINTATYIFLAIA